MKRLEWLSVVVLLGIFLLLAFSGLKGDAITFDERTHITAGYTYIDRGDYRLNPEHPPLAKLLAGLSVAAIDPYMSKRDNSWDLVKENKDYQWAFANNFLFNSGNDTRKITFFARIPMVLLGLLLLIYVFKWAKELYGTKAGLLALFLGALSPNIIAHSKIVQTDIGVTVFMFIMMYYLWKYSKQKEKDDKKNLIKAGLAFGGGIATKFTGLYLIPIMFVLFFFEIIKKWKSQTKKKQSLKSFLEISKSYIVPSLIIIGAGTVILLLTYQVKNTHYFFEGLKYVFSHSLEGHASFFLGSHNAQGHLLYFPVAFLIKTPIPTLIFLTLAGISYVLQLKKEKRKKDTKTKHKNHLQPAWLRIIHSNELYLLVPAAIYFMAFLTNNINIGLRHVLPIFPLLFVFAARSVTLSKIKSKHNSKIIVLLFLLIAWNGFEAQKIHPHELSYFNQFVGGPDNGWNYLADSNIDWGQDLHRLEAYLKEKKINNYYIKYFGIPEEFVKEFKGKEEVTCYPREGIQVISVNWLQGLRSGDHQCATWLRENFEPVEKIGYSIFIFDVKRLSLPLQEQKACGEKCTGLCSEQKKEYKYSSIAVEEINKCACLCK